MIEFSKRIAALHFDFAQQKSLVTLLASAAKCHRAAPASLCDLA